jgi:hypothetical protein
MADEVFQPADPVPESGVFQVQHYRHRLYHEVTICRGGKFPPCAECGTNVRFRLVRTATPIELDRNFSDASGMKSPAAR